MRIYVFTTWRLINNIQCAGSCFPEPFIWLMGRETKVNEKRGKTRNKDGSYFKSINASNQHKGWKTKMKKKDTHTRKKRKKKQQQQTLGNDASDLHVDSYHMHCAFVIALYMYRYITTLSPSIPSASTTSTISFTYSLCFFSFLFSLPYPLFPRLGKNV